MAVCEHNNQECADWNLNIYVSAGAGTRTTHLRGDARCMPALAPWFTVKEASILLRPEQARASVYFAGWELYSEWRISLKIYSQSSRLLACLLASSVLPGFFLSCRQHLLWIPYWIFFKGVLFLVKSCVVYSSANFLLHVRLAVVWLRVILFFLDCLGSFRIPN